MAFLERILLHNNSKKKFIEIHKKKELKGKTSKKYNQNKNIDIFNSKKKMMIV